MQKPKITKIYLDMDGVICDFYKRYIGMYGVVPSEVSKKEFDLHFKDFIETRQFATLDLMPDAMVLVDFLKGLSVPTEILSSTSNESRHNEISEQKIEWLKNHHIDFKPNLVPGKRLKKTYASPTTILIDDTPQNIDQWRLNGGIGILYDNVTTTIGILKMYV
jgi:hypothetical protein